MKLKQIIQRIIYPNRYSSEALIKHIRSGGGKVGENVVIFGSSSVYIDEAFQYISIGDNVSITRDVIILAHDWSYSVLERIEEPVSLRPQRFTTIGNNVFIGMRSIILQGTTIGDNVIIGAGSVVSGKVESNSVYAGNPARKICSLNEHKDKLAKRFPGYAAAYAKGFQIKNNRLPTNEEMVIYSTLISGCEDAYNGVNKEILKNFKKYKSVQELIEMNMEE